jgi:hypothetical protein
MTTPAPAETAPATQSTAVTTDTATPEPTEPATGDLAAEVEKWKSLSQKNEQRAKANATAAKELEELRKQSMTEVEKAAAEAEKRGAETALKTFGERLVRSDFTAAAVRINPEIDAAEIAEVLDDLNLAKFVGEDGEPDTEAIKKAAERLIKPAGGPRPPSFDGGARTTAPAPVGMNQLIRKAVGRA